MKGKREEEGLLYEGERGFAGGCGFCSPGAQGVLSGGGRRRTVAARSDVWVDSGISILRYSRINFTLTYQYLNSLRPWISDNPHWQ